MRSVRRPFGRPVTWIHSLVGVGVVFGVGRAVGGLAGDGGCLAGCVAGIDKGGGGGYESGLPCRCR